MVFPRGAACPMACVLHPGQEQHRGCGHGGTGEAQEAASCSDYCMPQLLLSHPATSFHGIFQRPLLTYRRESAASPWHQPSPSWITACHGAHGAMLPVPGCSRSLLPWQCCQGSHLPNPDLSFHFISPPLSTPQEGSGCSSAIRAVAILHEALAQE